ncbi:hypothetical protein KSC_007990 [Ktedonobacter sp. SOSP1-52]|nr:hypothetical protein KSC_007990 [Ktedonobacter sp. SOSP1-52]
MMYAGSLRLPAYIIPITRTSAAGARHHAKRLLQELLHEDDIDPLPIEQPLLVIDAHLTKFMALI